MGRLQDQLNHSMPVAIKTRLGDVLADLIASQNALVSDIGAILTQLQTGIVMPATLAIKAGSGVLVKSTSLIVARVDGTAVSKAANTDMPALVGTVADTKYASWDFYIDASAVLSISAKTADAATAAAALALLPATPSGKQRLGSVTIANASGAPFTGNTTALDASGITATYSNAAVAAIFGATLSAQTVVDLESR